MSSSETPDRWFRKVVEQLNSLNGVGHDVLKDGRIAVEISYGGDSRKVVLAGPAGDFRARKIEYGQLREILTELGIKEGQKAAAARRSRKPVTPDMLAARAKQQKELDAWNEVWRTIRRAEESLDVEYEITQMIDYY